jgi:thermitase
MNRQNIWIHITIAVIVIAFAAVLGQLRHLQSELRVATSTPEKISIKPVSVKRSSEANQPEVLVKFRPDVTLAEIKKLAAKNHDRVEDQIEAVKGLTAIDDLDNTDAETVAAQYAAMTDAVIYAEPVQQINLEPTEDYRAVSQIPSYTSNLPNDPLFNEQWALNNTGQNGGKKDAHIAALAAWQKIKGSKGIVVAVLDTGVDYRHTDLIGNMWMRPDNVPAYTDAELGSVNDLRGFNAEDNGSDPMDDNGHGTHCAGIIGAEGDNNEGIAGINWNVEIMPLKFLGRSGSGTTKDAIEAINYAIDRKQNGVNVRVINASWGSTAYSKALEDAIRAAGEAGIMFVAAAGNDGTSNDKRPHFPSNYDLPNVISVAATDKNDVLASFSNFGLKTVHIAAPGREIPSTWLNDDYREASGTSMAAPQVSGVAALILAVEPKMSVEKLRERILKSVDKVDSLSGKVQSGGRLNAAKALLN